jgi:gamma-glutamyl hercynylcysteine S-oxide synthase
LLLRPKIAATLPPADRRAAYDALMASMAAVPAGRAQVMARNWQTDPQDENGSIPALISVAAYYLDRLVVTNRQYQRFVDAGGYEQHSLWDEAIRPAIPQFVDRSGVAAPRYWECGQGPADLPEHPVVGVCWYEAAAYARWVGKRLPTDTEWIKAASWPMPIGDQVSPRRFPWGENYDRQRANLWEAGLGRTVPVDAYEQGDNPIGVRQLVGNVWEWTSTAYASFDVGADLDTDVPLKSLRGGAYDTYFPHQAGWRFQSGDRIVARRHNLGFRCALSQCDVADLTGMCS